jgi:alpha-L-arabinofuranosidase
MMKRLSITIALFIALLVTPAQAGEPQNWLKNDSFEQVTRGQPAAWRTQRWAGQGTFEHAEIGRTGKRSVSIASDQGGDLSWTCIVPVEPFARYRLTGWVRTQDIQAGSGRGALFNLHGISGAETRALTGTNDWTQLELIFSTNDQDSVQLNCLFGGWGLSTGRAWYDDLRLELLDRTELPAPSISIDAGKVGAPINKFIYGQFIEHMGRCIYGGIWAEMLEDRKFFDPVGGKQSPWRPVGGDVVSMVRQNSFVGEHTPRVALNGAGPAGIVQGELGLIAGREYVGRIWLAGSGEAGPVQVSLIWGDGPGDRQTIRIDKLGQEYAKAPLKLTAGATTDAGRLEIVSAGRGWFSIGTVSLMPADNVKGMRRDTLALLKELDSPIYRWPGGNFVSGYDWKDGIGDPDRRPPRKNPAWRGIEHNDMGLDEFIVFCRELNTEPYIAVNSGLGEVDSAVEQLLYANGPATTPMGQWRARNGNPEPYRVKYWGIGNEMYGSWQLGNMALEKYIVKHNQFAEAMRKADPTISLVAVGEVGRWSEGMMRHCADHMDLISEHFYVQERPGVYGHVRLVPGQVKRIADAHRRYRTQFESLRGKDIQIALDEWNYWYGPHIFGELGTRYFLKDGLGIAAGLNEFARNSDIYYMANYAQTVNVIGAIKTSKTSAAFETTGLVLKLYRKQFGTLPVATESKGLIDAMAAFSPDRRTLTIAVVNPTLKPIDIPLTLSGVELAGTGRRWQMAGTDPMVYNDPANPDKVKLEESQVQVGKSLPVAPCSVTLFALPVR